MNRNWMCAARASFYTFLGDLYHQRYVGIGGSAALLLDDKTWSDDIRARMKEEKERLLEEHNIRETYAHDYSEEYGVLRVFTSKEKK